MSEQVAASEMLPAGLELQTAARRPAASARRSSRVRTFALVGMDAVALALAVFAAHVWSPQPLHGAVDAVIVLTTMAAFAAAGCYRPRATMPTRQERRTLLMVPALIVMCAAGVELATNQAGAGDTGVRLWLLIATLVGTGRLGIAGAEALVRRKASPTSRATLIVGAGQVGQTLAQRLVAEPQFGLHPIGFLDKEPLATGGEGNALDLPVLGASWDLEEVIAEHDVQHVVVAFSTAPPTVVLDIVRRCWRLGIGVMVVPRLFEVEGRRTRVEHLGALPIVELNPSDPRSWQFTVKYAIDRIIASVALLALSPVVGAIALGVKLSSPGPVFFRQRRVGLDGHAFDMLKFRTMSGSPDTTGENDAAWAMAALGIDADSGSSGEDRRTRFGTFLRRCSLDELPQLWNVARGDMSLIGPRPERTHYVAQFEQAIYRYPERHRVKSGLTGWAQVNGLRGETSLQDRIEWDNFYIENWSPMLDLKIVAKTIPALLFGRGDR